MQNRSALITLVAMYFFWGSVAASLDILIPIFQSHFTLSPITSQLTSSAFFIAYFVGALVYFLISMNGIDILNKIGYKKGLIMGLSISTIGILGFLLASSFNSYTLFLLALFIVAFGFSFQQIVVNPLIIQIGSPETGSQRVSLGGSLFGIGATLAPLLLSAAIYGSLQNTDQLIDLTNINLPAIILAGLFVLSMLIISRVELPIAAASEAIEKELGALKFPQLKWGMAAIFVYVGVEVSIGSNLSKYLQENRNFTIVESASLVSLYWGSIMIGRWAASVDVFKLSRANEVIAKIIVPFLAFGMVWFINDLKGGNTGEFLNYIPFIIVAVIALLISGKDSAKTLIILGLLASALILLGLFTSGSVAMFCFISGGLFCSVMWPCIFNLAIAGLGKYTNQGSSLLIMMIIGGAIIPLFQGYLASLIGYHLSYFLAIVCFVFLAFYGWYTNRVLLAQGIKLNNESNGH